MNQDFDINSVKRTYPRTVKNGRVKFFGKELTCKGLESQNGLDIYVGTSSENVPLAMWKSGTYTCKLAIDKGTILTLQPEVIEPTPIKAGDTVRVKKTFYDSSYHGLVGWVSTPGREVENELKGYNQVMFGELRSPHGILDKDLEVVGGFDVFIREYLAFCLKTREQRIDIRTIYLMLKSMSTSNYMVEDYKEFALKQFALPDDYFDVEMRKKK